MPIDIRVLRYCDAIARHASFTKAANELRIAQPALSMAIKKLEDELGVSLFQRLTRKVVPSPEARLLLRRAERIFEEIDLLHHEIQAAADLKVGEVRIGMPPMFGQHFAPPILAEFHAAFPSVVITAMEGSAGEVRAMLDTGAIDLAILENRRVPAGWPSVEIGQDETVLCVSQDHPYAGRQHVVAQDLADLPMVVFDSSFLQRSVLDQICKNAGVRFHLVLQSNLAALIHHAVVDGLGASTMLRSIVDQDVRLVSLPFSPPEMFRFSLCWRQEHALSRANAMFVDVARKRISIAT